MPTAPNVLILFSDQHNAQAMGCAGHPHIRTPNLDRLAESGTRFSNAYCQFPLCCPSRMSFMTGRYPSEIDCVTNHDQLSSDLPTFAHAFGGAGYETILCGRMHFNGPDQRHGFQRRLLSDVIWSAFGRDRLNPILDGLSDTTGPNARSILKSGAGASGYLCYDEVAAGTAVQWLQERGKSDEERPFLMTVGFVLPHAPFVCPKEDYEIYDALVEEADLPSPNDGEEHPELHRQRERAGLTASDAPNREAQRRARVAYYGMCTHLDRQVGRVIAALEGSGLAENTLVVYISDHGEQLGEHGMWWKHTFYEGSLKVPMIIAGPGIPAGEVISQNVGLIDIGPTLLEHCGGPAIPGASGRSFRRLWTGNGASLENRVFAENLWGSAGLHRMIRDEEWKLCLYADSPPELFDLASDSEERCNLASLPEHRERVEKMTALLCKTLPEKEEVLARMEIRNAARSWVQTAFRDGDLTEPDRPWITGKIVNGWSGSGAME